MVRSSCAFYVSIFGKLSFTRETENEAIETEIDGWHGSSGLTLCTYLPTYDAMVERPKQVRLQCQIVERDQHPPPCSEDDFRLDLEIFHAM